MHLLKESQKSVHGVVRTAYMTVSDSSNFNLLEFLNTYPAQVNIISKTYTMRITFSHASYLTFF
jgi:hypothetical protein